MHYRQLLSAIAQAHTSAVGRAAAAVNQGLVLRNWLVGAYVVEFEQGGEDRAKYGDTLLPRLAKDLANRRVSGLGVSILERCRRFYQLTPQLAGAIPYTLSTELPKALTDGPAKIPYTPSTELKSTANDDALPMPLKPAQILQVSWSHWMEFLRLDDPWKRAFYENECLLGVWSVRQLQRQIGSLLYERTGLSKNKRAVVARARKQSADAPATIEDLIRDPYVLEFTGLAGPARLLGERSRIRAARSRAGIPPRTRHRVLLRGAAVSHHRRQRARPRRPRLLPPPPALPRAARFENPRV
jgi:hypothetical protein